MSSMLARMNFLFSVAVLTVLLFYTVGRFVFLEALALLAPALIPYFSAAYTLGALMLTVLVVAKTTIRLGPVSSAARHHGSTIRAVAAQATLCLAHLCAFVAVNALLTPDDGNSAWWPWILAPVLYAAGVATAVTDWRRHAVQATE